MSKWMKVDPATLKVGDEVRWVVEITGGRVIREVVVSEVCPRSIRLGLTYIAPGNGTWYVRKPKKAKPPVRPDEPPVGSFFRVDRTGELYLRMHEGNGDYGYLDALRQSLTMPNFITTHPKDSYTFRRVEPSDGEAK